MSTSSSVLSQTLQSITTSKLGELSKKQSSFNTRKAQILAAVDEASDDREKINLLLEGIARIPGSNAHKSIKDFEDYELDPFLGGLSSRNIRHFLRQSQYDPSVPPNLLQEIESRLRQLLEQKAQKFDFADLYSRLLTEWLKADATKATDNATNGSPIDEGEGFEFVERQKERLKQLSEKFESVVFTPLDVDATAIEDLLSGLFATEEANKALSEIRERIRAFGEQLAADARPFDSHTLKWVIAGLLKSDLLSETKNNTLETFRKDDVVLEEIADVLNMRFVDLASWTWNAEAGIPVEPRRQLNGKYRVVMDEDILQSIFLHFISTSWAVEFNGALTGIVSSPGIWRRTEEMPRAEIERREYFLGKDNVHTNDSVACKRHETYMQKFFMCQLASSIDTSDRAADYDDGEDDLTGGSGKASGGSIKQQLLRTIGSEIIMNRFQNKHVAVIQSDLQWFATSTSHKTVDCICKFFGVPAVWREFFQRYLAAPLRMIGLEGEQGNVRFRRRGVPIGHVFQKVFGELIIFSMDLAVNQEVGMLLYRLHDDLWLCGEPAKCAKAWKVMERCAQVMGVEFNHAKTGSVYINDDPNLTKDTQIAATLPEGRIVIGFLELDAETGDWIIDQKQVDAHTKQLQRQLAECTSVFSWVQTWNSCIGRFFNYTFGQPANCFGRKHVDMILETHQRIQEKLFGTDLINNGNQNRDLAASGVRSVTEHLKSLIKSRFNVSDIPDAFLYFPEELGGLGLRNPFIPFLVIRDSVIESPHEILETYSKAEEKAFRECRKEFEALSDRERKRKFDSISGNEETNLLDSYKRVLEKPKGRSWPGPAGGGSHFLPWEDFVSFRFSWSSALGGAYDELLTTPSTCDITPSRDVKYALYTLAESMPELGWYRLGSERMWLVALYAKEVFERFGGLALVDRDALPIGVLKVVKGRKVVWQSVL